MDDQAVCPVCKTLLQIGVNENLSIGDRKIIDCPRCGSYEISRSLLKRLPSLISDRKKRILLSYTINKMQAGDKVPYLDLYIIESILNTKLPSLSEQYNNIILYLGRIAPGVNVDFNLEELQTIMGSETKSGIYVVISHLTEQGLITSDFSIGDDCSLSLKFEGWEYYEELKRGAVTSRKAFMAMKYGNIDLDWMFENCFKLATKAAGFDLYRIDRDPKAGLIDDQLRVEIRTSRFLIADLTHDNQGAYWEAGFAEGLGKPVIYLCNEKKFKESKTHFDTNHQKTILWESDESDEAINQLKATIRATLPTEAVLTD